MPCTPARRHLQLLDDLDLLAGFERPPVGGNQGLVLDDAPDGSAVPSSPGQPATLGVGVDDRGAVVRITLRGELDLATSTLLDAMLDDLLRKRRVPRVARLEVQTADVSFVDAAGISPLLHARAVLTRRGGVLSLPDPSPSVRRLLTLLGLSSVLGGAMETPA